MTTADQLSLVERRLGGEVRATALAEGGLVQGWMKRRRMLVVATKRQEEQSASSSSALLVFVSASFPVSSEKDLTLESALPIDAEFKCEIDSGDAVLLRINRSSSSSSSSRLMFEMLPGYHTQNLVAEIFRQTENAAKAPPSSSNVEWAVKFLAEGTAEAAGKEEVASLDSGKLLGSESTLFPTDAAASASSVSPALSASELGSVSGAMAAANDDSPESSLDRQDIATGGAAPIAARESVVKYQMALKEELYTSRRGFTVFVGTWNVNGQSPGAEGVSRWLADEEEKPPDLYAVGFQELDLSKEAFLFNESPKEEEWRAAVAAGLHPGADYRQVKLVRLVGMMLVVFVKVEHAQHVSNVSSEAVGTGIMGKLGNKGGVAVRMEFHNTSICFVCSHLAAHVSECERRNQDYHDICTRMLFGGGQQQQPGSGRGIKDHDMIYWLGDLNYRITDRDAAEVKDMLKANRMRELQASDQFAQQRALKKVFVGYKEGDINFLPTYKFDPGTSDWDSSEKARAPAWTDRILWKGEHIEQSSYKSHMSLAVSDHKPVSATFKSDMKVVDPKAYRRVYEDVMKKLDRLENEFLPQVTVDSTEVAFQEPLRFMEPRAKTLAVANTGQVPVQFQFIRKLNDLSICKPWLSVEPTSGFVMPGEKADVTLEVMVDKRTAGAINCGKDQLYDILVLHLVGGKDIFVTVSGEYKRSCFGASLDALCSMTVPIADLSLQAMLELEGTKAASSEEKKEEKPEPYPVPKELWFLCDLITSLGLEQENLFLQPGLRAEVLAIRDWLDTGLPVEPPRVSVHSAAEALLLFLESLREPIVPSSDYARCLDGAASYLQCRQAAAALPPRHRRTFEYAVAFLREVAAHSAKNGADPKILATLFSGVFLRDPPGTDLGSGIRARTQQQLLDHKKARFVYHFIVNDPDS